MALVGDAALAAGLARFEAAGATDLLANLVDVEEGSAARTFEWLASWRAERPGVPPAG